VLTAYFLANQNTLERPMKILGLTINMSRFSKGLKPTKTYQLIIYSKHYWRFWRASCWMHICRNGTILQFKCFKYFGNWIEGEMKWDSLLLYLIVNICMMLLWIQEYLSSESLCEKMYFFKVIYLYIIIIYKFLLYIGDENNKGSSTNDVTKF